jgi:DNA-binding transcriptional LysR family regulator
VRHAQAALLEMQRAADEVEALRSGQGVRVSIGTVMSPGTDLVPLALSLLAQRNPQMAVDVEMDFSRPMVARLLQGRLELVVGRVLDPEYASALHFEPLAEEPHRLVARPGHPLARQPGLGIADLVEFPWVLPQPQSILRERLVAMFLQRGLAMPRKIVETSSLPLIVPLLRGTEMLVALPEDVVRPYCDAGMLALLPVDLGVSMAAYGLITPRDRPLSPGAAQMLGALREAAALLASGHGKR